MPPDSEVGSPEMWLQYAKSDLALAAIDPPAEVLLDTLCYHCQQAAEKALKAVLVAARVSFPPTHNLKILVEKLPSSIEVPENIAQAVGLTTYAVSSRYPDAIGPPIDIAEYAESLALARGVVEWAESQIASQKGVLHDRH